MLLNKSTTIDIEAVMCFKLVNGDEMIAKVVDVNADEVTVSKPLTLIPSPQGMAMVQSLFAANLDKPIPIRRSNIMMYGYPREDVEKGYLETTSGIQLVR